jgi:hypothetical protein
MECECTGRAAASTALVVDWEHCAPVHDRYYSIELGFQHFYNLQLPRATLCR